MVYLGRAPKLPALKAAIEQKFKPHVQAGELRGEFSQVLPAV